MTTENIEYDPDTKKGTCTIMSDNVTIIVPFKIEYRADFTTLKQAVSLARTKAYAYYNGIRIDIKFRKYMDFISVWFEPCAEMLKSRGETSKSISKQQCEFYVKGKNKHPSWMQDIDIVCSRYFKKD